MLADFTLSGAVGRTQLRKKTRKMSNEQTKQYSREVGYGRQRGDCEFEL